MARPLRILLKNGWYHVTARGNRRQKIYLDTRDRSHFLELLGGISKGRDFKGSRLHNPLSGLDFIGYLLRQFSQGVVAQPR